MTPELIAALSAGVIGPVLAYLKVREERLKTGEKRDTQMALVEKRLSDCEKKMNGIDDLKDAIAKINNSLTKIETILEMYIKKMDRE